MSISSRSITDTQAGNWNDAEYGRRHLGLRIVASGEGGRGGDPGGEECQ